MDGLIGMLDRIQHDSDELRFAASFAAAAVLPAAAWALYIYLGFIPWDDIPADRTGYVIYSSLRSLLRPCILPLLLLLACEWNRRSQGFGLSLAAVLVLAFLLCTICFVRYDFATFGAAFICLLLTAVSAGKDRL